MSTSLGLPDIYFHLLTWLLNSPEQVNERTGRKVRVGRGGTSFRLDLSDGLLPTVGLRKTFPKSAAAENAWYVRGERDVSFIRKYAPLWDKFVEDDGLTIAAAYGYRWQAHFGRNQLSLALDALDHDPSDRRCYVSAWDPRLDGLGARGQKNVPCPLGFTLSILDGELHSTITLRSSDVFVGLPYDVMGHALLMAAAARSLNVRLGVMQVNLAHAHLYDVHYDLARECLKQEPVVPTLWLPASTIAEIRREPDSYVLDLARRATLEVWPEYNPRPEVVA
jgi:thymidylate synthase